MAYALGEIYVKYIFCDVKSQERDDVGGEERKQRGEKKFSPYEEWQGYTTGSYG